MRFRQFPAIIASMIVFGLALSASAQINVGSDGSDGDLLITSGGTQHLTIDLAEAATGSWDTPSPVPGKGVYDPVKWAVVFKWRTVTVTGGFHHIRFLNHPSGAPVVFLVQQNATFDGNASLFLTGQSGAPAASATLPGPGGFRGGHGYMAGATGSAGFGPGGGLWGFNFYDAGSYATRGREQSGPLYGNPQILPLIGGSGGSGRNGDGSVEAGGAGGGAIMIAVANTLTMSGTIDVGGGGRQGGSGAGSGGAIHLIANSFTGTGGLWAYGGNNEGGLGRIRIEANNYNFTGNMAPTAYTTPPAVPPILWADDARVNAPTLKILTVDGVAVPADPRSSLGFPMFDTGIANASPVIVRIQANNMPLNWLVSLRVVPRVAADFTTAAAFVSGDQTQSIWQVTLTVPGGLSTLQARATKP